MSLERVFRARPKAKAREIALAAGAEVEEAGRDVVITCFDPDRYYWANALARDLKDAGCRVREVGEADE